MVNSHRKLSLIFILVVVSSTFGLEYLLPKSFGNFTHDDLKLASSCGTVMTTYNNVQAKSNGEYQGTGNSCGGYGTYGYQYQCVEYVQRYFGTIYKTQAIWYGNAKDLCTSHPSNVAKTSSPSAGDAVVFGWGTYGHTAIVKSISGSTVSVVEQNASPGGLNSYSTSDVLCYLKYTGSSGSCPHAGYYCGNDGLGSDANNLYYCSGAGAKPALSKDCSFTCVTMPSGQDDQCSTSGTCSSVSSG